LIASERAADDTFRQRFEREARLTAAIDHPNVIPIYAAGEEDGNLYLVMRYVAGTDLAGLLKATGRVEPERAARITAQVAEALDAAHAAGLVHRDIKPANVLLAGEHIYLSDFGITRAIDSGTQLTDSGQWLGTVDFCSPEQLRGERTDARSDVYALGCLLYTALTGSPPHHRDSATATMLAHLNEPPPHPSLTDGVPEDFDDVIDQALAKDPAERYPSAGDLGRAALAAARGRALAGPWRSVARGSAAPDGETGNGERGNGEWSASGAGVAAASGAGGAAASGAGVAAAPGAGVAAAPGAGVAAAPGAGVAAAPGAGIAAVPGIGGAGAQGLGVAAVAAAPRSGVVTGSERRTGASSGGGAATSERRTDTTSVRRAGTTSGLRSNTTSELRADTTSERGATSGLGADTTSERGATSELRADTTSERGAESSEWTVAGTSEATIGRTQIDWRPQPGPEPPKRRRRRRGLARVGLLAVVIVAAAVAVVLVRNSGGRVSGPLTKSEVTGVVQAFANAYGSRNAQALGVLLAPGVQRVGPTAVQRGRNAVLGEYRNQLTDKTISGYRVENLQVQPGRVGRASAQYVVSRAGQPSVSGKVVFGIERVGDRPLIGLITTQPLG
jgi:serine/threonine-protein kinase